MEHSHDKPFTPEEDAALAQDLLIQGDLAHGVFHLSGALFTDPHNPDWLALLDRYIATADEPLTLAPLNTGKEGNWLGTVAVHAYILAKLGRAREAVEMLLQVHVANADVPFLDWAIEWLEREPALGPQIDRGSLMSFFGFALSKYPGTTLPAETHAELRPLLRVAEHTLGDPDPETMLNYSCIALYRKLGRLDEAQQRRERAYRVQPCWHLASSQAEIHRARGDQAAWLHWQQKAIEHDPLNVPTRLDVGDCCYDKGDYAAAARWYQEALQVEPHHPWATPSLYAARHYAEGGKWLEKLKAYAAKHPDNERAAALLQQGIPFVGFLPEPQEATLGILRQITELAKSPEGPPQGEVKVTLSALEAPARVWRAALGWRRSTWRSKSHSRSRIQQPDPRVPRGAVRYQVWKYKEERKLFGKKLTTEPVAAVPEPSPEVARAIAALAAESFDRPRWFETAGQIARDVQPRIEDLLGVMVHPPELPSGAPAPIWLQRVQTAAALTLAHLDPEVPWKQSRRRQVLFDLANGPMDWTNEAAIIALTALAQHEPAIGEEVISLFAELLRNQPQPGYVCYERAVVYCFQQLPDVPSDWQASLAEYERHMETQQ